ncbi:hypothetical protein ACJ72_02597 [Emergomyces africanus]|uniref:Ecp2 effector protein domain-containing protein n=1 Tax=Emergomyces africanus TaxID=1955775 RepID=A0A1B7P1Z3_9EURO|nr:hypothetical protein ACJ72_02597 [Emergomyces africanus]
MKFLSLTLIPLAGLLASSLALSNSQQRSEVSTSDTEIDIGEIIPSVVNATGHSLSARHSPRLLCYNSNDNKWTRWAADGRHAIGEVGKRRDNLEGKSIYEVAKKFCSQAKGHKFNGRDGKFEKIYWFRNAWKNFRKSKVPVTVRILDYGKIGAVEGRACTDMMTMLISGCIAQKKSRLDHFRGGALADGDGKRWVYHIFCDADYCYVPPKR